MKKIVVLIGSFMMVINCYSQQLPIFNHYLENPFIINPAIAGNNGLTVLNITHQAQWIGITDAPVTSTFSAQGRILKRKLQIKHISLFNRDNTKDKYVSEREGRVGLGAIIIHDKDGLIGRTDIHFAYAYHSFLRNSTELSFGLSMSLSQFRLDQERIIDEDPIDPVYSDAGKSKFIPNADAGIMLLNRNYFAGLSSLQLFKSSMGWKKNVFDNFLLYRHYVLLAGYNFYLNENLILVPSALVRSTDNISSLQSDFSLRIFYKEAVWLGATYRTNNDFIGMMGFNYKKIFLSYYYDYASNLSRQHTYTTHEVSVSVKFGDVSRKYKWLDRY